MGRRHQQQNRTTHHLRYHAILWQLLTVFLVVGLTVNRATARRGIAAQPSPQDQEQIAKLLDETLPLYDIVPQRLPGRFRQQVIVRIYEHAILYRADTQATLNRASPYLPMIERTLHENELPVYFAYIPLVESAFRVDAIHPESGARGLWQLMPATARGFGLEVSPDVDERLDPQLATQAAVRYLRRLDERFGPKAPLHVLAAYNHGDTNLANALRLSHTQDIWELYSNRSLPYQTRDYLIKMVALWIVVAHAPHFELTPDNPVLSTAQIAASQDRLPMDNSTAPFTIHDAVGCLTNTLPTTGSSCVGTQAVVAEEQHSCSPASGWIAPQWTQVLPFLQTWGPIESKACFLQRPFRADDESEG